MLLWFVSLRTNYSGLVIADNMLQDQARDFVEKDPRIAPTGFKLSSDWYDGFKRRVGLHRKKLYGEAAGVSTDAVTKASNDMQICMSQYPASSI